MAIINFLYRSKKNQSKLLLRIRYEVNEQEKEVSSRIDFEISHSDWKTYLKNQHKKSIKDAEIKQLKEDTDEELEKVKKHFENLINKTDAESITTDWLKNQIDRLYHPDKFKPVNQVKIPTKLNTFIDYYINQKTNDLTKKRIQRLRVTQRKLQRFEKSKNQQFEIIEVNDNFKKLFVDYCKENQYSINTIAGDVTIIKTICLYAELCGIDTHPQLRIFVLKEEPTNAVYLSLEELEQIKAVDLSNNERLDNVRDWLIISYFTGQRISDFMRFNSSMIIEREGKQLLAFTQTKGKKKVVIPILAETKEIINKHNGEFPRSLSSQKYNDYLKELCKLAGINEIIKGAVRQSISKTKTKLRNDYRSVVGEFPKWQLMASHVGRRSFATNFYGKIPTSVLIGITGHSTEKMFLQYIRKTETDKAMDAFKYFE